MDGSKEEIGVKLILMLKTLNIIRLYFVFFCVFFFLFNSWLWLDVFGQLGTNSWIPKVLWNFYFGLFVVIIWVLWPPSLIYCKATLLHTPCLGHFMVHSVIFSFIFSIAVIPFYAQDSIVFIFGFNKKGLH